MTAEILSIIAVCISGITAICSAAVPAILNYKIKKAELVLQTKRENEQKSDIKFQEFYEAHLKVVTDFSELYAEWKNDARATNRDKLIIYVSKLSDQFRDNIKNSLIEFATKIKNFKPGDNLDEEYYKCFNLILKSYGVRATWRSPNILISDMLKVALREQFYQLRSSTTYNLEFHHD